MKSDSSTRKSKPKKFTRVGESLYRYVNKTYYAVFRCNGKLLWKNLDTKDPELARRRLKEERDKSEKIDPRNADMNLEGLLLLYDQSLEKYAEGTRENRRAVIKNFRATWANGLNTRVRDVTSAQLEVWMAKHRGRMKKTSFNAYILVIRQLFGLAIANRAIVDSPANPFKILKPEKPIRLTPTWGEFQAIVADIRRQRFSAEANDTGDLVEFMGLAGVGMAECANLHGEHIDFDCKKFWLFRAKTRTSYAVPMFPQVIPLLRRMKEEGKIATGKPIFAVADPKKALTSACKRLKLPQFSSRSLRRCFITRAVERGIDFKTIGSWQGHQDGGVLIAKTYSHLRNEHSDTMAQRLVA